MYSNQLPLAKPDPKRLAQNSRALFNTGYAALVLVAVEEDNAQVVQLGLSGLSVFRKRALSRVFRQLAEKLAS